MFIHLVEEQRCSQTHQGLVKCFPLLGNEVEDCSAALISQSSDCISACFLFMNLMVLADIRRCVDLRKVQVLSCMFCICT